VVNEKQQVAVEGRLSSVPRPFLRWAGSKQALIPQILPLLPANFGRYYEPFLGSGALFFALRPKLATLSDYSSELIGAWRAVRDHHPKLEAYLAPLKPSKDFYYRLRANRSSDEATRAAEFLYLNKTCWNGLYRVNGKGEFNVPYGAPRSDFIFDAENLLACSNLLKRAGVSIRRSDFKSALATVRANDLVFLDPPYVTKHNFNGFRDWNERLFSWQDQERLAETAKRLADKGAHVVVSNADHPDVIELYAGFHRSTLVRASTLASDTSRRGSVTESIFYC
jgi:DNA adenine methylase